MDFSHYVLKNGVPTVEPDVLTWARWFEDFENRVVEKTFVMGHEVSTVFLGLNHRFGEGEPILYETMIFGPNYQDREFQERFCTLGEAKQRHFEIVGILEKGLFP